ncbi:hypothetical protein JCM9279_002765 [Rhodotorula babjevae]
MRFSFIALLALAAPAVFAVSVQDRAANLAGQAQDQLTFAADQAADSVRGAAAAVQDKATEVYDNFDGPCPNLLVRCVRKDQDAKIVGDIGEKEYKHKGGLKCVQKHETVNKAECNAKYPIDCAAKCDAVGSPI